MMIDLLLYSAYNKTRQEGRSGQSNILFVFEDILFFQLNSKQLFQHAFIFDRSKNVRFILSIFGFMEGNYEEKQNKNRSG